MERHELESLERAWLRQGLRRRDLLRLLAAGVSSATIAGFLSAGAVTAQDATPAATGSAENPFGEAQNTGGTYVVVVAGAGGYPQVFRPMTYYGSLVYWCCKLLFTPLILLDRAWTEMTPGLATSWEWNAEFTQLTAHLRQGVTFHDGQPFTARDVEFTYKLMVRKEAYPSVPDVTIFQGGQEYKDRTTEEFAGVTVVDDYTVQFNLTSPSSVFLLNVSNTGIVPAHAFAEDALTNDQDTETLPFFLEGPIGTGPFKLASFDLQTNITFEANPNYFKGAPNLDGIIFRLDVPGPAMISGLEAGEFDGAYVGAMPDAAALRDLENLNLDTNYSLANEQIFIVATEKPEISVPVRQALRIALDVETLSATVGYGFPSPAPSTMMHPSLFPNPTLPNLDYDPDRARQLLQEGGWDPNRTLVMGASPPQGQPSNFHAAIMEMWQEVGLNVEFRPFDPAANTETWSANPHEFDVFQTSYAWLAYDPSTTYGDQSCERSNYTHYCNPTYDETMEAAIREGDAEKAAEHYKQAQTILTTDLPYIPIWIEPEIWGIQKTVHGGNLGRGPLNDIQSELWWKE
jgi:peptide/nickel transport system substrate-binding protein